VDCICLVRFKSADLRAKCMGMAKYVAASKQQLRDTRDDGVAVVHLDVDVAPVETTCGAAAELELM